MKEASGNAKGNKNQESVLALIPAKGASTRLKRKNVLSLGGKTLLQRAVDCAMESGICSDIVVSTEDDDIAGLAKGYGAEIPFIRPEKLSVDPAGVEAVALHALDELEKVGRSYKTLAILLPTCPLRTAEDLQEAYRLFSENDGRFLMSVSEYEHSPFSAWVIDQNQNALPVFPHYRRHKSQELPKAYRCNGAIHILDVAAFRQTRSYTSQPLLTYVMPRSRSFDIDTEEDLLQVRAYLSAAQSNPN
ncbi:hypothetical protein BTA51_08190 [Hahella sp. CCB-MM4]|uniref:acylneuraminate cytidylyltransferase family protein n=1 Tax=Hahella sp. (strain CCB-MM4) TaxID=1926491 RepID=UPI000B9B66FB|nr:acylneuraminate cytidylyltransferase family protein [Hahella sp. CCB-MM4]OZG73780.1 hypothetical protein BTA51_08190 [Hahella sp. CCB-MM4]